MNPQNLPEGTLIHKMKKIKPCSFKNPNNYTFKISWFMVKGS